MKQRFFSERTIPIALFLTCFLSYGLLIPWLGFFWDDWPYIWFSKTLGAAGFSDVFSKDRPFLAILYSINLPLLGSNPLVWQFFALIWRWFTTLAFWKTFSLLWPTKQKQVFWASMLFAVYPGFGQHWISVIYSEAYIILTAFLVSMTLMMAAVRKMIPFWPATIGALVLSAFNLFSTEYFFGLELLRPAFLWLILSEMPVTLKTKIKNIALQWLPYIIVLVVFTIWRAFIFQSNTYQISAMESMAETPRSTLFSLLFALGSNFLTGGWLAWNQTLTPPNALAFEVRTTQIFWIIVLTTFAFSTVYLIKALHASEHIKEDEFPDRWGWISVLLGTMALLLGGIPFWIANLPLTLVFPWNRFTLALMIGSVLLLVGLLEIFIRTMRQKVILLSILISLAAGWQFYTANTFRREWEMSKDFFWQLSWRVPDLKENTLLLTHEFPFKYYSDNSLTAPINWMYAPDFEGRQMPYMLNYLSVRLKSSLPSAKPDQPVNQSYRAFSFEGNTSDSLALYLASNGCLKVMDPVYTNVESIPNLPDRMEPAIPISNLSQIVTDPPESKVPAPQYFPEPEHTWCYYYQKIDLERQKKNWDEAARLGNEAVEKGFMPNTPTELPVLIETFGHVEDWDQAVKFTENAYATNPSLRPALCDMWDRIDADVNTDESNRKNAYIKAYVSCGEPVD